MLYTLVFDAQQTPSARDVSRWSARSGRHVVLCPELDAETNASRSPIKQSKTDPFRQGVEIFLGRSGTIVCPVQALIQYIGVRPATPGPFSYSPRGCHSPGPIWFPIFSQHSGRQVWTTQPTMGIVFELAPQPLQRSGGWKIR